MWKILLAVDGSDNALHAVAHAIKRISMTKDEDVVHLINVQNPLHGSVSTFIDAAQIKQYHQEEGMKALAGARRMLDDAGIPYQHHLFVGEPAEVIVRYAKEQGCDEIIMGTHGQAPLSSLLMGSVSTKVVHLSNVPVLLVK